MSHLLVGFLREVERMEFISEFVFILLKRRIHMFHKFRCTNSLLILLKLPKISLIINTKNPCAIIRQVSEHDKYNKLWLFGMNDYVVDQ